MEHASDLSNMLKPHILMDKHQLDILVHVILMVIQFNAFSFAELALSININSNAKSTCRRLQRLLLNLSIESECIGCWLLNWFYGDHEPV